MKSVSLVNHDLIMFISNIIMYIAVGEKDRWMSHFKCDFLQSHVTVMPLQMWLIYSTPHFTKQTDIHHILQNRRFGQKWCISAAVYLSHLSDVTFISHICQNVTNVGHNWSVAPVCHFPLFYSGTFNKFIITRTNMVPIWYVQSSVH